MHQILETHCRIGRFSRGYLLTGDFEDLLVSAKKASAVILKCDEKSLAFHPDFSEQTFDSFLLEDSRDLARKISAKPVLGEKRVFILTISSLKPEAGANLAQIMENMPLASHIFLAMKFSENIPQTLRFQLTDLSEGKINLLNEERSNFWKKFFKSDPVERLSLSKEATSDKKNAQIFLNELEIVLAEHIKKENKNLPIFGRITSSLDDLKSMRRFLSDPAASSKMIVEHFALTLPQF